MNKAKRSRSCNPLEGVGTEEGELRFWILQLLERGRGGWRAERRSPPSIYLFYVPNPFGFIRISHPWPTCHFLPAISYVIRGDCSGVSYTVPHLPRVRGNYRKHVLLQRAQNFFCFPNIKIKVKYN